MLNRHFLIAAVSGLLFGSAWFFHAAYAHSAPFCVQMQGAPSECWYYDISSCWKNALERSGECTANLKEVRVSERGAPVCLLDSSLFPQCSFNDLNTCQKHTYQHNAVCFERPLEDSAGQIINAGQQAEKLWPDANEMAAQPPFFWQDD